MSQCVDFAFQVLPAFCVKVAGTACLQVTAQTAPASLTLAAFTVLMTAYNAALPRCANEEEAALTPYFLVSGDEFIWAADTDVGIAGDKHIMGG